jgi:Mrp family chromosome partitioning ATPase
LESVLGGVVDFESAVIRDEKSGLDFLPAAGNSSNPIKLLASPEFAVLMSRIRRSYDFVIIDSPPVLRVADALIMAESAELVLFVVGSGLVSSGSVSEAIRRFSERDRRKIMTLLTRIRSWRPDVSDYYSGYEPSASRARLEYAEDA